MAEKSICRSCFHSYVCEQFNEHRDSYNEKCHFFNDHFVSAEDAALVVRCKDCKYRSGLIGRPPFMFYICTCAEGFTGAVRENDFCSRGERKDGEW